MDKNLWKFTVKVKVYCESVQQIDRDCYKQGRKAYYKWIARLWKKVQWHYYSIQGNGEASYTCRNHTTALSKRLTCCTWHALSANVSFDMTPNIHLQSAIQKVWLCPWKLHMGRRRGPTHQSLFWYDNDKDLKRHEFVAHVSMWETIPLECKSSNARNRSPRSSANYSNQKKFPEHWIVTTHFPKFNVLNWAIRQFLFRGHPELSTFSTYEIMSDKRGVGLWKIVQICCLFWEWTCTDSSRLSIYKSRSGTIIVSGPSKT